MMAVSSTCGPNLETMARLFSIGMAKSLTSMALRTVRRTRLGKTWRAQVLPLRPRSGKGGFQMMAHVMDLVIRMDSNLQSPMLSSMHHEESNLDRRRPLALDLLHRQDQDQVGTRQSRRRATRISVWTYLVTTQAMGILCGCGSVMDRSRSGGFLTVGRFALVLMSRNA